MEEIKSKYRKYDPYMSLNRLIDYYIPIEKDTVDEFIPKTGRKIVFGGCGEVDCPCCMEEQR